MSAREYKLQLSPPAHLIVHYPDDSFAPAKIDVYEAHRLLAEAEQKPPAERWAQVNNYLATKLAIVVTELTESVALEFHDTICAIVEELNEERKKKAESIASSPEFIPASPPGCC